MARGTGACGRTKQAATRGAGRVFTITGEAAPMSAAELVATLPTIGDAFDDPYDAPVSLVSYRRAFWGDELAFLPTMADPEDEPDALHRGDLVFADRRLWGYCVNLSTDLFSEYGTVWASELDGCMTLRLNEAVPMEHAKQIVELAQKLIERARQPDEPLFGNSV